MKSAFGSAWLLLSLFLTSSGLHAQICKQDTSIKNPGFYPAVLDSADIGIAYRQELQIRVIKDTSVIIFGTTQKAYIDSVVLRSIIGLPGSFTYKCYNSNCRYVPDTTGCAVLTGTAVSGDEGVHPLKLVIDIYGRLQSGFKAVQTDTIRSLTLVVNGSSASVRDLAKAGCTVYPNPAANGRFTLITSAVWLPAYLSVYSADGRLVEHTEITEQFTEIKLNASESVYFSRLQSAAGRELWKGKIISNGGR